MAISHASTKLISLLIQYEYKWLIWAIPTIGSFFLFSGEGFPNNVLTYLDTLPAHTKTVLRIEMFVLVFAMVFGSFYYFSIEKWFILFKEINYKQILMSRVIGWVGLIMIGLYTFFVVDDVLHIKTHTNSAFKTITGVNYVDTSIQLILEEMWTIVPFLAILTLTDKITKNRNVSIITAWIVSSIIFALYRISSYDNDVVQVLLVIFPSRIFLTYVYIKYKSIWASYITHLTYNITIIILTSVTHLLLSM